MVLEWAFPPALHLQNASSAVFGVLPLQTGCLAPGCRYRDMWSVTDMTTPGTPATHSLKRVGISLSAKRGCKVHEPHLPHSLIESNLPTCGLQDPSDPHPSPPRRRSLPRPSPPRPPAPRASVTTFRPWHSALPLSASRRQVGVRLGVRDLLLH